MAGFTPWTVFITSGSTVEQVLPVIVSWINRFQNASPPSGGNQREYGLTPSGEVYQFLYAFLLGVTPTTAETAGHILALKEFGVTLSDRSATKLNITPGTAFTAGLEFGEAKVAQIVGTEAVRGIINASVAKVVSAAVDADNIQLQATNQAIQSVNLTQIFSDVSTTLTNALLANEDDIITTANLTLFRSAVATFTAKQSELETRIASLESVEAT